MFGLYYCDWPPIVLLHFRYWQNRAYHGRTLMNGFGCTCWAYSLYSYIVARTEHIIISAHDINISLPFPLITDRIVQFGKLGITLWHHPGVVDMAGYTSQKFQWLLLSWPIQIYSVKWFGERFRQNKSLSTAEWDTSRQTCWFSHWAARLLGKKKLKDSQFSFVGRGISLLQW